MNEEHNTWPLTTIHGQPQFVNGSTVIIGAIMIMNMEHAMINFMRTRNEITAAIRIHVAIIVSERSRVPGVPRQNCASPINDLRPHFLWRLHYASCESLAPKHRRQCEASIDSEVCEKQLYRKYQYPPTTLFIKANANQYTKNLVCSQKSEQTNTFSYFCFNSPECIFSL